MEDKPATISIFAHENAMMHKDADNERMLCVVRIMRNIVFALCAVVVIVVTTLVAYYTSRTQMWNDTISKLNATVVDLANRNSTGTEVANGIQQQPDS
ncbi:MAG: hypothetical protein IKQ01_06600 [Bacteroidales bacterium]|nr:hypothetical protein [Bacteroidales bacterium]